MDKDSITVWALAAPVLTAIITAASAVAIHVFGQRRADARETVKRKADERAVAQKSAWERNGETAQRLRDAATALLVASADYVRGRARDMDRDETLALVRTLNEAQEQYGLMAPDALEQLAAELFNASVDWTAGDPPSRRRLLDARRNLGLATRRVLNELSPYPNVPEETRERLASLGLYTQGDFARLSND